MRPGRPSHATFVAYAALFIALGSGAYAAVHVTSANIVDHTIKGRDVKPNSLGGTQVNEAKLDLPQVRAGRGDGTALTAQVILSYPKQGFRSRPTATQTTTTRSSSATPTRSTTSTS